MTGNRFGLDRRDLIYATVLFAASLIYLLSIYDQGLNLLDEGYLVTNSLRVLGGQTPYLDFQNNYAPGRYYIFSLLFRLFGKNFLVTRITWVVLYAVIGLLGYFIVRRVAPPPMAALAGAMLVLTRCPWQKTFFILFQVICIWIFFVYFERRSNKDLVLCGVATVLAALTRQDIGIYAFIAFTVCLGAIAISRRRWGLFFRSFGVYSAATAVPFIAVMAFYLKRGALLDMLDQYLFSGIRDVSSSKLSFPAFGSMTVEGLAISIEALLFYLPLVLYLNALLMVAWRTVKGRFSDDDLYITLIGFFGLLVYAQILNRSDLPHLWQILPPACLLVFFLLKNANSRKVHLWPTWIPMVPLMLMITGYTALYFSASNPQAPYYVRAAEGQSTLNIDGARVKLPYACADELEAVERFVNAHTQPDQYIMAIPDIPMLYFLCDRPNPLRYDILRPGVADKPEAQERIVAEMKNKGVRMVIFNDHEINDGIPGRLFKNCYASVYRHLVSDYHKEKIIGSFSFWLKNEVSQKKDLIFQSRFQTNEVIGARSQTELWPKR